MSHFAKKIALWLIFLPTICHCGKIYVQNLILEPGNKKSQSTMQTYLSNWQFSTELLVSVASDTETDYLFFPIAEVIKVF